MRLASWIWLSSTLFLAPVCEAKFYGLKIERVLPDGQVTQELVAGESMNLRISGVWHNGCVPTNARFESSQTGKRLLVMSYSWPLTADTFCTAALAPVRYEVPAVQFSVDEVGAVEVTVIEMRRPVTDAGQLVGALEVLDPLELAVQPPLNQRSNVWPTALQPPQGFYPMTASSDLTGHWFAPEKSGSGLLLKHDRRTSGRPTTEIDQLSGLWANFATDGKTQWHWLADGYWATPNRYLGWVYRAETEPFGCTAVFPNPACTFAALPAESVQRVGIFELRVEHDGELILTFDDSGTPLLLGMQQPPVVGYQVRLQRM